MRTTIEISDHLRAEILKLAAKRGIKGFSQIIEEALTQHLLRLQERDRDIEKVLKLRGTLSQAQAQEMLHSITEIREQWRLS